MMKTETVEAIGAASSKATALGAFAGFWGWLTSSGTLGLIGAMCALGGWYVNWYYKREANRRHAAAEEHKRQEREMRMDLMRATGRPIYPPRDTDLGVLEADE